MIDIRKLALTTFALGLIAAPSMAMDQLTETNEQTMFQAYDHNNDGGVTVEEFAASVDENVSLETFTALDVDQNGMLTNEEFEGLAAMQQPEITEDIIIHSN